MAQLPRRMSFNGRQACQKPVRAKIMRRILRKIAANECDGLGDTSTLADPSVVDELIEHRANQ
ncbi:hypothetical protein HSBAA_52660 [Vreelandella sulfidaeris]|uniref:AMP-binding enzyme C-terminal domain-containing protein n=1 Tax=Vreelandella sulfidaeris TaxID=115553 RepID=A0A455UCK4_9GAMM|nr:hypothetical protein HSBAA_52660 [Halomonas sulfidaeris]